MYRPSQTPRLAVSSNRITREHKTVPVTAEPNGRACRPSERSTTTRPLDNRPEHHSARLAQEHRDSRCPGANGARVPPHRVSKETMKVVVFHWRCYHLPLMLHLSCLLTMPD